MPLTRSCEDRDPWQIARPQVTGDLPPLLAVQEQLNSQGHPHRRIQLIGFIPAYAGYRTQALVSTFGKEWATICEHTSEDRFAAITRIQNVQGNALRDTAWPTKGGNDPAPDRCGSPPSGPSLLAGGDSMPMVSTRCSMANPKSGTRKL